MRMLSCDYEWTLIIRYPSVKKITPPQQAYRLGSVVAYVATLCVSASALLAFPFDRETWDWTLTDTLTYAA